MNPIWTKAALVGVHQPVAPEANGPAGEFLAQLAQHEDAASGFARCIAALAAFDRSAPVSMEAVPVEAAADDPRVLPSTHPWAEPAAEVFSNRSAQSPGEYRLRAELCTRLAERGFHLPFVALPAALETARGHRAFLSVLQPVLGPRGHWLAARNPAWSFAIGIAHDDRDDPRRWQEGARMERIDYLARLRARDRVAARELLQQGFTEMAAEERQQLLPALRPQLGEDDIPFLEQVLAKDRSREVKLIAARLLANLPASAHAQRLPRWITPLLTAKRSLLGRSHWTIDAPTALDPAWSAAAIEPKPPAHAGLGERAWWLYQLVRQVPLRWWETHTGWSPRALLDWAVKTDWTDALLRGWREQVDTGDDAWIEALLAHQKRLPWHDGPALLALLPPALREQYWPDTIDELHAKGLTQAVLAASEDGGVLSAQFSAPLYATLRRLFEGSRLQHSGLHAQVLQLATLLHPDVFRSLQPLARNGEETPASAECATAFERILRIRHALHHSA